MGFLSVALSFVGYTLIYAAVANHGRFATTPWTGVMADAYTGDIVPLLPGLNAIPGVK